MSFNMGLSQVFTWLDLGYVHLAEYYGSVRMVRIIAFYLVENDLYFSYYNGIHSA